MACITGVSDHDLMFSKKAEDSGMHRGEHWPEPVDSRQAARPPPLSAVRQRMANASGKHVQLTQTSWYTTAQLAHKCSIHCGRSTCLIIVLTQDGTQCMLCALQVPPF